MVRTPLVYVIDDDISVRTAFSNLLDSAALRVVTFTSAEEFFVEPRDAEDACILIDIRMPGMTGLDFQRCLMERNVTIPVIVVSASDDVQLRNQARQLGAVSFFRKPIDDQALLDAIWWAISLKKEPG